MPPPLDLPPPPLIWPHPLDNMVRFDLHVNHLVSLRYNIHIVTNHTMYIHTLVNVYYTHTWIPMNYILYIYMHNLLQIFPL